MLCLPRVYCALSCQPFLLASLKPAKFCKNMPACPLDIYLSQRCALRLDWKAVAFVPSVASLFCCLLALRLILPLRGSPPRERCGEPRWRLAAFQMTHFAFLRHLACCCRFAGGRVYGSVLALFGGETCCAALAYRCAGCLNVL